VEAAIGEEQPTDVTQEESRTGPLPIRGACLAVVLVCLALGGVSALETRHVSVSHGQPLPWSLLLASTLPRWLLLAATLPFALHLATRPSLRLLRPGVVVLHATLFLAISFAHASTIAWGIGLTSPISLLFPWSARLLRAWYEAMPIIVSMYGGVLAAAWALNEAWERERRSVRASQLETQLQTARLTALRARLQPHFLYNTLNGIAALVADSRPALAVAAIEQLSELLHASLQDDERDVVSVREEVALAERYLALQQMRFGERLQYALTVAPEVADCTVPVLLLQPLVENAVVHGMDAGQERLSVVVTAMAAAGGVELRVENDGPGLDLAEPRVNGHGVGLSASRARLTTAYGDGASLRLEPRPGGGVVVRLVLPHRSEAS
jgi:two-component system, LytTR family, sensor kinase